MALYDGFFDAMQNDETGEYDRAYESGDFTGYFANIIGSGVCVHNNPDSFLVRLEDGKAVVSPGYLFIAGYWLKNDADYNVDLPGDGTYAIVAHLNLGKRMIEIEARTMEQAYPDSLVLAIVSPASAEDTRYNADLCGVIDTAGELSTKVEWAINYIDDEIESKLVAIEQDIAAQEAKLDAKIAEVQAVADSISPPPVGSIKFSAAKNVGEEWLPCDGRFVNESDYPELVEALGKLIPSEDKFQLISDGEIGPQISNGVVYEGRMWVYSYSTKKLYGVDVEGSEPVKEITVTSDDPNFSSVHIPTTSQPIALSIVKSPIDGTAKAFLAQILVDNGNYGRNTNNLSSLLWLFSADFDPGTEMINVSAPFNSINVTTDIVLFLCQTCVPYVVSRVNNGVEYFSIVTGVDSLRVNGIEWSGEGKAEKLIFNTQSIATVMYVGQRVAFNPKNKGEAVLDYSYYSSPTSYGYIRSYQQGIFSRNENSGAGDNEISTVPVPLNIVGEDKMLLETTKSATLVASIKDTVKTKKVDFGLSLPTAARIFVDGGAYLWGKDVYMIFVGTGIIFSRTLAKGDFGYLDTTSVLGTITQFGYLGYSQDEGTLYLLGQDTTNRVKAAKIVLNTLYDYANDGAWLPVIAADGVPAYIKAYEPGGGGEIIPDPVDMKITVTTSSNDFFNYCELLFNGESIFTGSYTRTVSKSGSFTVRIRKKIYDPDTRSVSLNGTVVASISNSSPTGSVEAGPFKVSDYITNGITLSVR